ncbi:MAG: fructose-bisphosphate aldolase class I [Planctomycetota bacterium]|nr:fructose-bisphosphate aldolase class I [Planctomycetota bacterium]
MSTTSTTEIRTNAAAMVAPGKGLLAADESTGTIEKRLAQIDVEASEENRRAYRDLLFTTDGAEEHISGVILFDETLRQSSADGTPFPKLLATKGILPGIKVDKGAKDLAGCPGEKVTEGLDGLRERFAEYYELGARFAKWRAVIDIADGLPTDFCLQANAHALARYAALAQEASIVPIVEPEVLMDGGHDLARCYAVTRRTLRSTFDALSDHGIDLEGMILKPNMVIPGKKCANQASAEEIAANTVACFKEVVPAAVAGIMFLSGGQSEREATANLNAINALGEEPWKLSFSYGRALQQSVLKAWLGKAENVAAAQKAYRHRARLNGAACQGEYSARLENELVTA